MRELQQILQLWRECRADRQTCVLATVVRTEGSSYRLPGARMLLDASGRCVGSISGGCLEADLLQKAWWLTETGPAIRRYDTTADGDLGTPFGLGCNGVIHILLERLTPSEPTVLDTITTVHQHRRAATVCHVLPEAGSQQKAVKRWTRHGGGASESDIKDVNLLRVIEEYATSLQGGGESSMLVEEQGRKVFLETLAPPIRLLIFGAGNDAVPLAAMANYLGWQTEVFDGRSHYAKPERFPGAFSVRVRRPGDTVEEQGVDAWTVAVLMTHSYSQDLDILRSLSRQPLRYIGLLGPRKRSAQLIADAGLSPGLLESMLHAPMGLDIGADGPEQVALSVLAEIQAVLNEREGGLLRARAGTIHSREDAGDAFHVGSIACVS